MRHHPEALALALALGFAQLLTTTVVAADEPTKIPSEYVLRGLTLPEHVLTPEVSLEVTRSTSATPSAVVGLGTEIGAHFGVVDRLTVGALVAPILWAPSPVSYGNPRFDVTVAFLGGDVELGATFAGTVVPARGAASTAGVLEPGVPAIFHFGKVVRLDLAAHVPVTVGGGQKALVGLRIPVALAFNVAKSAHLGLNTGFQIVDREQAGPTAAVPLGVFGGYSVMGKKGPIVDISPYFRWPALATPGASGDKVQPGTFQAGVSVCAYLYL